MYHLIGSLGVREFLRREGWTLVVALGIAELFYKFHSFLLEAVAFLGTWYVLSLFAAALLPGQVEQNAVGKRRRAFDHDLR